jgi:hypothetical protein
VRIREVCDGIHQHNAAAYNPRIELEPRDREHGKNQQPEEEQQRKASERSAIIQVHGVSGASQAGRPQSRSESDGIADFRPFSPFGKLAPVEKNPLPLGVDPPAALVSIPFDNPAGEGGNHGLLQATATARS